MANTFELISAVTVGAGGASSISFTSIPSTFTDLCLKLSLRSTSSTGNYDPLIYRLNSSSLGYTAKDVGGNGSAAGSGSNTTMASTAGWTGGRATDYGIDNGNNTASTFSSAEFYIPNYAGSNNKSLSFDTVLENNGSTAYIELAALLWSNTAAITQFDLGLYYGNFAQYSTAYLYGVKNA